MKIFLAALALIATPLLGADAGNPVVTLAAKRLEVSNVSKGGDVLIFGVARATDGYEATIERWSELVTDTTRAGAVGLDVPRGVPFQSIWVVVDLQTAKYVIITPDGYHGRHFAKPKHFAKTGALFTQVISNSPFLDVAYLHAGGGVWFGRAEDGGLNDADGKGDNHITLSLDHLQHLGGAVALPPDEFKPGGVLITINSYDMEVEVLRLDGQTLNGAN